MVENVVRHGVGDGDPVVERVGPVDAAGRPVHRQPVDLRRYPDVHVVQLDAIRVRKGRSDLE